MTPVRCPRSPLLRSLAAVLALFLAGCSSDGSPGALGPPGDPGGGGPPGTGGTPGIPGIPPTEDLPGLLLAIRDVTGATGTDGTFQIGDHVAVRFTIETKGGDPILLQDLDYAEIYASGPTTNYQPILEQQTDVRTAAVANADGSYTYTFAAGIPATFLAPLNDSDAFRFDPGARASEQTGRPLVPGTYTVGTAGYRNYSVNGEIFRDAGNDVRHFLFGGATTLVAAGAVTATACNRCHNDLRLHGGIRKDVQLCVLCHTAGAEDRVSTDPAKATEGTTIDFRVLIHRLHRGDELRSVRATAESGDPFLYEVIGFNENVTDYSHVAFPPMPGGDGFNQQTRNCEMCHEGAADADAWFERPSRQTCGACHDDVDFDDGTRLDQANPTVADGTLDKDDLWDPAFREAFHVPQADDSSCIGCHADNVADLSVRNVHRPPLLVPDAPGAPGIIDLQLEILSITGGTGPSGSFLPGDMPQVTFEMRRGDGTPVAAEDTSAIQGVLAGPTGNYQKILPAGDTATLDLKTGLAGTGPFTVTLAPIPVQFPAQVNDNKRTLHPASYPGYTGGDPFTFANGSGELKSRPLDAGTYTFGAWAQRQFVVDGVTYREASVAATEDILLSGATTLEPHEIVTDATCNSCHLDLRFHGSGRRGVKGCVLCHASGAEDNWRKTTLPPEAPEPDTIDFRVMIHQIHNARDLDVVQSGGVYDLGGFGGFPDTGAIPEDFSFGELPAMPGGAKNCTNCHSTDAWRTPTERPDVRIWSKACSSCHDSPEAATHIALNTAGTVTTGDPATTALETCILCHGPGAEAAVDTVHKPR